MFGRIGQFLANSRLVKGAAIDRQSKLRPSEAIHDLEIILGLNSETSDHNSPLRNYINTSHPSWTNLITSFRKTTQHLQSNGTWSKITNKNIFPSLRLTYQNILHRRLSIDLVSASLRQRSFATKITTGNCTHLDSASSLFNATIRYGKFLALMQPPSTTQKPLLCVPTLDIDLCWHTHQLFPRFYREWCTLFLARPINHDDTIGQGDLDGALKETAVRWFEVYGEEYTTDDLKRKSFSNIFQFRGGLFGLVSWNSKSG
jgi:Glycine-rich domain-containing protein-like